MLGGGVFVTQNKVLPGSYINVVNTTKTSATIGERGVVAIALNVGKSVGKVIEVTKADFLTRCEELLGVPTTDNKMFALREIFCHANKVYVYDTNATDDFSDFISAIEPYEFNVFCVYGDKNPYDTNLKTAVKHWRDELGKKCQLVVYNVSDGSGHEGIVNVTSTPVDGTVTNTGGLVPWVAGALAGCPINESCTNMLYDGELEVSCTETQAELEQDLENGEFKFHNVYGEVRVLEDINSLIAFTDDKGEDFKYNQTIRVVDQIANDIAKLFNTKYLGRIPNNASGRVSLWGDIVKHHRELEELQAIEAFNADDLKVEQGVTKKSVVVHDAITVVNAMAQLYMTIVVS